MRRLFPEPVGPVDVREAYAATRPPREDRPWLLMNMVTSVDGHVSVDGRSGPLGGPADRQVFRAVRGIADVIVVAAGTVRAESYGPPTSDEQEQGRRRAAGVRPVARLAIVTGRVDLDLDAALFHDPASRPIIVTTETAPADRVAAAGEVADVVVAGGRRVDPARALGALRESGAQVALLEGGPSLNGAFVGAGLVDEVCLTVSPMLVGGEGPGIVRGPGPEAPVELALAHLLTEDGLLFLRYVRC